MIEQYNEIEWLTGFLNGAGDLKAEGLDRVKNFLLLWNLFEDAGMQQDANIPKLKVLADYIHAINPLKADEFKPYVDYFSNRYFNPDGKNTYTLDGLKFRPNASDQAAKAEVEAVLTGKEQSPDMILKALLMILYRFRNNLFHGEKQLVNIDGQVDNFIVANSILKVTLSKMKDLGMFN